MRVVVADCSAIYTGRGDTKLARGLRSILIKDDGSVSIHNEKGNKPMNYMKTASFVEHTNNFGDLVWTFDSRKESLSITIHNLVMSFEMPLISDDPGLERDGTENHLHHWLAQNPNILGEGYEILGLEYPTGNGPVDILALDSDGLPVAVEVKRIAMIGSVDQTRRYIDAMRDPAHEALIKDRAIDFSRSRGLIAAVDIRPKTYEWAKKHNIETVLIPETWRNTAVGILEEFERSGLSKVAWGQEIISNNKHS